MAEASCACVIENEEEKNKFAEDLHWALAKVFGEKLKIENFAVSPHKQEEGGYENGKYDIDATLKKEAVESTEKYHIVGKVITPLDAQEVNKDVISIYVKEVYFYDTLQPLYKMIMEEFGMQEKDSKVSILPEYFGASISRRSEVSVEDSVGLILIENLNTRGYYSLDSQTGLDLEHAKYAIQALAKFHALGMVVMNRIDPKDLEAENFDHTECNVDIILQPLFSDRQLRRHVVKIKANLIEHFEKIRNKRLDGRLYTIIHGNIASTRLFMFHKNESKNIDAVTLVDFQDYLVASPFRDLSAFLCSCISIEVMQKRINELLNIYYNEFITNLKTLKIDIGVFTKEIFEDRLRSDAMLEFPLCAFMYGNGEERLRRIVRLFIFKKWIR